MESVFICDAEVIDLSESLDHDATAGLEELCCFALRQEAGETPWTVSIVLTNDEHLTRLHDEFMGIPEPTDIMTFPDDEDQGGDIVISIDQANRQRVEDNWSLQQELQFLTVHGVLHLAGWDDATDEMRAAMLNRQRAIIEQFQKEPSSNR